MTNKFFTNKTMWLVLLIVCCCFFSNKVQANDYLEKDDHYKIYATGINKIHFVIPVWAYGKSYDYYAYDDSYICYTPEGGSETRIGTIPERRRAWSAARQGFSISTGDLRASAQIL